MVLVGTKALETYGKNSSINPYPFAADGVDATRPMAANRHVKVKMKSEISPIAPSHPHIPVDGSNPTSSATPKTSAVATKFRTTLATTCPVITLALFIGIVLNRSMMPLVMSCAMPTAVLAEP